MVVATFSEFLGAYLFWVFLAIFIMYILGKPRRLIVILNKLWLIKLYHNIPIFGYIIGLSLLNILYNLWVRSMKVESLERLIDEHRASSELIIAEKKFIFMCERTIFLYSLYMVFIMVFMKFSNVYEKKYELEDQISELEASGKLKKD